MNYEALYKEYDEVAGRLKTQIANQQKLLKRINKSMDAGDLKSAAKDLASAEQTARDGVDAILEMSKIEESADMAAYLGSGEFAAQLIEQCDARGINIIGEESNYEIFPYRLKINAQDEEVLINGRKAPGLRPAAIATLLETGRNKLLSANFNAEQFAAELAAAYDLAIVVSAKGKAPVPDADIYLNTIYKYLTPMRRFKRDYDAQSFAFDIARLYSAEETTLPDGRKIQFGPSRNNNRAIRILDDYGNELFIATVRFYQA